MTEVTDKIAELVRQPRYFLPAVGIILLGLVLVGFKDLTDLDRAAVPALLIYTIGAALVGWWHTEYSFWNDESLPKVGVQERQRIAWLRRKKCAFIAAGIVHVAWAGIVIGASFCIASHTVSRPLLRFSLELR